MSDPDDYDPNAEEYPEWSLWDLNECLCTECWANLATDEPHELSCSENDDDDEDEGL